MARHGRGDQQLGLVGAAFINEMLQLAEGLARFDLLDDGQMLAINLDKFETEFGLLRGMTECEKTSSADDTTEPISP
jgi:hypothetical protein